MTTMTISEVAQSAGVRPSTLRYYESIGLLPEPPRISGRRRYDAHILQRLAIIQTAQQAGFSLTEMRVLFDDILSGAAPAAEWHSLVQRKLQDLHALLRNVYSMKAMLEDMLNCDEAHLEECIFETGQKHKQLS
jgi:MerR family redox-sensitive transcriptional activator SoxR